MQMIPTYDEIMAEPSLKEIEAETHIAQGLRFDSVERDGDNWAVEFTAGEYRYRYHTMARGDYLSLWIVDNWRVIARGSDVVEMILDNVERMAGLTIDWPAFRMGYEQFYCGYVSGWFAREEESTQ